MKKRLTALFLAVCFATSTLTVLAASTASFTVNNVSVLGTVSYTDANDINPLVRDSVTASTTSGAAMDVLTVDATIQFGYGSEVCTITKSSYSENATATSATASASLGGVGCGGTGYHYAGHNGRNGTASTDIRW